METNSKNEPLKKQARRSQVANTSDEDTHTNLSSDKATPVLTMFLNYGSYAHSPDLATNSGINLH